MKDTYYFSHDYNPTSDPKIQALIGEYGATGYGIYWRLVEMMHDDNFHKLEMKRYMYIAIAKQMSTCVEQVECIVENCINVYELFVTDGVYFWSERVMRNIDKRSELSKKRSNAGKISAKLRKNSTCVEHVPTSVEQNATKERKGKENINKQYKYCFLSEIKISDEPDINNDYFQVALSFQQLFMKNLSEAGASTKLVEKAKGTWIDSVRLMIEEDGYTLDDLRNMYKFLQNNVFWKKNILSMPKLREQMARLKMEMKNGNESTKRRGEGTSWDELAQVVSAAFSE